MSKTHFCRRILIGLLGFLLMPSLQAGIPLWTFIPLTNTHIAMAPTQTATVQYLVTNQSTKLHTLVMLPIAGINQDIVGAGNCSYPFILGYQQSCILSLQINGSTLTGDIFGGPIVCQLGNLLQCYQPDLVNGLVIQLIQQPPSPPSPPNTQYTVISSADANGLINPSTSQVVNSGATLTFIATPNTGYGVNQWFVDGTLVQTGGNTYQLTNVTANHSVNVTFGTITLTPSVSTLALSINCQPFSSCTTTQNAALTGNPRQITILNTGSLNATNVLVSPSGLPSGTNFNSTCSGILNAGSFCTITLTPGSVASSDASSATCTSGTQPVAGTVTVTADGGISNQINIYVLGYGCQYQGGFLYSVDDTTPNTSSLGGKVLSLVDQAEPFIDSGAQPTSIIWSSNGSGALVAGESFDIIPLIAEISSLADSYNTAQTNFDSTYANTATFPFPPPSAFANCSGAADGACNTGNILAFYNSYITGYGIGSSPYTLSPGPTNTAYYAAGLCTATINTYSDWYLPSICEMDAVNSFLTCPGIQSMVGSLSFLIGNPGATTPSTSCSPPSGSTCLAGDYWSSTEYFGNPSNQSWGEKFDITGGNSQIFFGKAIRLGARCSRALTL